MVGAIPVASEMDPETMRLCREFRDDAPPNVVVSEPYLPYIPSRWNGTLVLCEAQNLVGAHDYRARLLDMASDVRMHRLDQMATIGGIKPWDDGTLKLALSAALPRQELSEYALSNAVPWSLQGEANLTPDDAMQAKAATFWKRLFAMWSPGPRTIITLGNVAFDVMIDAGVEQKRCQRLRLPSPTAINRVCGMFRVEDLLNRFPEVSRAAIVLGMKPTASQVFFACHAVSLLAG